MKLVVDNGNTRAKVAVFSDDGEEVLLYNWQQPTLQDYEKLLSQYEIDAALICSVGAFSDEIFVFLKKSIPLVIQLDENTPLPLCFRMRVFPYPITFPPLRVKKFQHF